MTNYESLGIRPIINACATLTKLGGSLMPPEVMEAMNEASRILSISTSFSAASATASPT